MEGGREGGDGEREEGGSGVPAWPPPGTPAAGWFPSRTAPSSCPPPDRERPPPPSGLPSEPSALARASSAPPPAPPWPGEFPAAPASAASCPVEESQRPLAHFNADSSWIPECCHDPWHSCEGYITLYNKNKYLNDIVLPFCGINAKGKIKYILYLHRTTKKLFHRVKQVFICKTVISMAWWSQNKCACLLPLLWMSCCWKSNDSQLIFFFFATVMRKMSYRHDALFLLIAGWLLGRVELVVHLWQLVLQVSDLRLVLLPLHLHLEKPDDTRCMWKDARCTPAA